MATKRALIVEDQRPVRESLGKLLKIAGFDVRLVGDGHAGLAEAMFSAYDLVAIDLNMPSLDGFRLIESIVAQEGPNRHTLREYGVIDSLSKPFEAEQLLELAENVVR